MSTPEADANTPETAEPQESQPRKWRRMLLVTGIIAGVVVLLCGVTALGAWLYARDIEGRVERIDAFEVVPEASRPAKVVSKALNILLLGTDSQDADEGAPRADTIMLIHLPAARDSAQLISIPRDTWVHIPKSADGKKGGRDGKINAGFSIGGASLAVQTVEAFTKIRIDNVVMIDFSGFKEIIDALGGVTIEVDETFTSIHGDHRVFAKGSHRMTGEEALDYSRQRKQFKDGDFTRIEHQQQVVRAVLDEAIANGLSDPDRLNGFLKSTANALTADRNLSVIDLALQLRNLRNKDLTFLTSPSKGIGTVGDQSVVLADKEKAASLYAAVNADQMAAWLAQNGT